MSAAHTPGPWSLSSSFDRVERRVKHGDNPPLVWGIASGINSAHPDYIPRAEQIANARLIASAPDLIEALEAISSIVPEVMSKEAEDGFRYHAAEDAYRVHLAGLINQARTQARAAIAKAKGGAS